MPESFQLVKQRKQMKYINNIRVGCIFTQVVASSPRSLPPRRPNSFGVHHLLLHYVSVCLSVCECVCGECVARPRARAFSYLSPVVEPHTAAPFVSVVAALFSFSSRAACSGPAFNCSPEFFFHQKDFPLLFEWESHL